MICHISPLIKLVQNGSPVAFEKLWRKYSYISRGVAYKVSRNPTDSEDIVQICALTLWRQISKFHGTAPFSTWLYRVSYNCALMFLRTKKQLSHDYIEDIKIPDLIDPFINSPDHQFFCAEISTTINRTLNRTKKDWGKIFELHHVDCVDQTTLARRLHLTPPAVKSTSHRCRLILRKKLLEKFNCRNFSELKLCANQ